METLTLQATFDGKVFVPDKPVQIAAGQKVELRISEFEQAIDTAPMQKLIKKWESEPLDDPGLPPDYATQIDHYLYGTPKRDV